MWIERTISAYLKQQAKLFPVLLVTGPRQVGKTSLLRKLYGDYNYFTLDHPALAAQLESQPQAFFKENSGPLILDEVQYVPQVFRYLKILVDEDPRPGRFLLTGSQSFALMEGVSESLAGRCGVLPMTSLTWEEVLTTHLIKQEKDYLLRGGYPALYGDFWEHREAWYGSYLSTYLERDIRNIRQVASLRDFDRLLRLLASRVGQTVSFSALGREIGLAANTVKNWIQVLLTSGQIFLLEPYYRNVGKRLVKSPKLYFSDVGLAVYLLGINKAKDWEASPLKGALWENHLIAQVKASLNNRGKRMPLWYWRTSNGEEVDLLIEQGGRFDLLECKLSESPGKKSLHGLVSFEEQYGSSNIRSAQILAPVAESYFLQNKNLKVKVGRVQDFLKGLIGDS